MHIQLRKIISLFLLGAIVGTLGNFFHYISGAIVHSSVAMRFLFISDLLTFGLVTILIGIFHSCFYDIRKSQHRNSVKSPLWQTQGIICFLILYCLSGFLPSAYLINTFIIALVTFTLWLIFDQTWQGIMLAIIVAIIGTTTEILMVQHGLFSYSPDNSQLFGVPLWLPYLYLSASILLENWQCIIFSRRSLLSGFKARSN